MERQTPMRLDMTRIREVVPKRMPWSPRDYVRGLSIEGDTSMQVENLTHELSEGNDLRFLYKGSDGCELGVFAEGLPWDSDFFGYGVARLNRILDVSDGGKVGADSHTLALRALLEAASGKGIKYLFGAIDPRDLQTLRALGNAGFALIETRAYYHMPLQDYDHPKRYPVRAATANDLVSLQYAARTSVNPYDRFHADPFLAPDADRMMDRWMEASILEGFADVTIVPDTPNPTAFCTVKYHRDKWPAWKVKLSQPVLSAVSPEYRGWYRKLISEINFHLRDVGAEHSFLCTQVTNRAVIRVWESLRYRFGAGNSSFGHWFRTEPI
jgi:hypothetical protein